MIHSAPTIHTPHPIPHTLPFGTAEDPITVEAPVKTAPQALSMDAHSVIAFDVYSGVLMGGGF